MGDGFLVNQMPLPLGEPRESSGPRLSRVGIARLLAMEVPSARADPGSAKRCAISSEVMSVENPLCIGGAIEIVIPIRLAEKRIYHDCRTDESSDNDDRTRSSRPTVNISASLCSYQSRSQSVAWSHDTSSRNKIRQRSSFELGRHTWCQSWVLLGRTLQPAYQRSPSCHPRALKVPALEGQCRRECSSFYPPNFAAVSTLSRDGISNKLTQITFLIQRRGFHCVTYR
jgi:hypothetical protein